MELLFTICAVLACLIGVLISMVNWCLFYQTLKTKSYHSPIGFIGGLLVYFSLRHLLPASLHPFAALAFLLDASYPLFLLGVLHSLLLRLFSK